MCSVGSRSIRSIGWGNWRRGDESKIPTNGRWALFASPIAIRRNWSSSGPGLRNEVLDLVTEHASFVDIARLELGVGFVNHRM